MTTELKTLRFFPILPILELVPSRGELQRHRHWTWGQHHAGTLDTRVVAAVRRLQTNKEPAQDLTTSTLLWGRTRCINPFKSQLHGLGMFGSC